MNILLRLSVSHPYNMLLTALFISSISYGIFIILYPKYLKVLLIAFGMSFILFGFHSHSLYNQAFELLLTIHTMILLALNIKENACQKNYGNQLICLLLLYIILSILSLLMLPVEYITKTFILLGLKEFATSLIPAVTSSYMYPLSGVNRLILFFIFIWLLSGLSDSREIFKSLFIGILYGTVLAIVLGILDYYSIICLDWFRPLDPNVNPDGFQFRLQSTFGHPGWFAEFITVTIPFILIVFLEKQDRPYWKPFLLLVLIMCEIALILAKARAGWICYPITLIFWWIFFYFFENNRQISRKTFFKILLSIPLTILISLFIILKLIGTKEFPQSLLTHKALAKMTTQGSLVYRVANLLRAKDVRFLFWQQGIDVGRESPFFGMGYESFRWHKSILSTIHKSYLRRNPSFKSEDIRGIDTPHNLFVQLFISGGFVGVSIWVLIIGYTLALLLYDLKQNKNLFNISIILSIISFHLYGIFQSMQYISVVWLLIFLDMGYAFTIDETVIPEGQRRFWNIIIVILVFTIGFGALTYFNNLSSRKLAEKYGLKVYAVSQTYYNYMGFYDPEKWPPKGYTWRWSKKEGIISIPRKGTTIELTMQCNHPDIEEEPVIVNLFLNNEPLDEIIFTEGRRFVSKRYRIPESVKGTPQLLLKVSRTWNPYKYKVSRDKRDLGIAVREIRFVDE